MSRSIVVTQSNYIPWKGYFDAMALADEFVLFDDAQFTRRDWRNRNLIKTPQGLHWLTIPVEAKGRYFQKINETRVSDPGWWRDHWKTLAQNYARAAHFRDLKDWAEDLYAHVPSENLSEVNHYFLALIAQKIGIERRLRFSSDFNLREGKTERLLGICEDLGATDYYSGPAAKAYLDEGQFATAGIRVHWLDYSGYPEHRQLHPPFAHGVSILDLMFNEGTDLKAFLKCTTN